MLEPPRVESLPATRAPAAPFRDSSLTFPASLRPVTTDASRRAAVAAVSGLTESLIDTVNGGVADVFEEQKQIDGEARALRAKSQKFAQVTGEWVRIVEGFDERLRGIGDFETWIKKIEFDLNNLGRVLEDIVQRGEEGAERGEEEQSEDLG